MDATIKKYAGMFCIMYEGKEIHRGYTLASALSWAKENGYHVSSASILKASG
jgi:hypothetical protein